MFLKYKINALFVDAMNAWCQLWFFFFFFSFQNTIFSYAILYALFSYIHAMFGIFK